MSSQAIRREKTALRRTESSLPVKCLSRDGLLEADCSFLDYGCGHGVDVRLLSERGVRCTGWDPVFAPDVPLAPADIVNLGYVINVIENPEERAETLRRAWGLCQRVMAVAAQIMVGGRGTAAVPFNDGIVTRLGTFQKYFTQEELRHYLETQLDTDAVAAAPGVFYLFKDELLRQSVLARRYQRRPATPRKHVSELRFDEHRELLEPLMEAITDFGRLPDDDEFATSDAVIEVFGSLKRAFALIRRVTGDEEWEAIRRSKTEDLTVYMALARFRRRPPVSKLPMSLQRDIRSFFGTYKRACEEADALLFRAGDAEAIDAECKESKVGKLLPNALYVHRSALAGLSPLLRVYEGCARMYIGDVPDANIIKLHRFSGKVSYLAYPDFDATPHPALYRGVKVALRSREVVCYDYGESDNPPVLHRKEAFVLPDYPDYAKFERLTQQEERQGLLDDAAGIGNRQGWNARLLDRGFELRGHRLVKRK